jgi:hypothetical protein
MLPVGHTYVSLYATSDNETHFRMVQVQLDLVEDFAGDVADMRVVPVHLNACSAPSEVVVALSGARLQRVATRCFGRSV